MSSVGFFLCVVKQPLKWKAAIVKQQPHHKSSSK